MVEKDYQFLFDFKLLILALVGSIGYCIFVYNGFFYAPVAHGVVFFKWYISAICRSYWLYNAKIAHRPTNRHRLINHRDDFTFNDHQHHHWRWVFWAWRFDVYCQWFMLGLVFGIAS